MPPVDTSTANETNGDHQKSQGSSSAASASSEPTATHPTASSAAADAENHQEESQHNNKVPISAIDRIKPQLINAGEPDGGSAAGNNGAGVTTKQSPISAKRGSSPSGARRGSRDFLAPAGINIERRRGSSQTPNYRIEKNQVIVEGKDGSPDELLEILEIHDKPGKFKRALPALPLAFGILFGILNFIIPGIGTLLGGVFARFASVDTEPIAVRSQTGAQMTTASLEDSSKLHANDIEAASASMHHSTPPFSKKEKLHLNVCAAILQVVSTPIFLIGWIWSINWGIILISLAMQKRMKARQAAQQQQASSSADPTPPGKSSSTSAVGGDTT